MTADGFAQAPQIPARNERPVRGDNRTGQAIWALGVDGRSRRIQPRWGGITAPTDICRGRAAKRSNRLWVFLTFSAGVFSAETGFLGRNYRAAARLASPPADLSEATAAAGWFSALLTGTSSRSPAFLAAGVSGTAATAGAAAATAETAA